jgi:predicted kinase
LIRYDVYLGIDNMREEFERFISENLGNDTVLITCGLPGSWKTETAEELAKVKGYPIVRTDLVRLEVLKNEDIFDEKVASNMDKRKLVYAEVFRRASELVKANAGVILDATFVTQELRLQAAEVAAGNNKRFVIMQTSCPQEISISRILRRTKDNYESNALTEQAYINNKNKFEQVDLAAIKTKYNDLNILHFTVDTTKDAPDEWYVIEQAMA